MIPYGHQQIDNDDINAVVEVLRSDYLTCGAKVIEFETALARYCGAAYAIAVSSGTAALHLAMLAARLGPGDRGLTSANTFLASANAVEYVGAIADFADIDPQTLCVGLSEIKAVWQSDVKAVVAVDYAGYPCVSKDLANWIHDQGAIVVEDACHAIGAARDGYKVGGLPWVDMTVFSFHPVKTMTTGEGGAVLTDNADLAERCRRLRNHGMQPVQSTLRLPSGAKDDIPLPYRMSEPGYNYRITDIQCALGVSQLAKLDAFVERRRDIVKRYDEAFFGTFRSPVGFSRAPLEPYATGVSPAWHLYTLQLDCATLGKDRRRIMAELRQRDIGTQIHYAPVHLQPYYAEKHGYCRGKCPVAEAHSEQTLSLPLFAAMNDAEVEHVIAEVSMV